MSRRKRCRNFLWREEDSAYQAERENDRLVFRKLKRERAKPHCTHNLTRIIRRLFKSPLWAPRMSGKSAESWRRKYNVWRKKVGRCASGKIAI